MDPTSTKTTPPLRTVLYLPASNARALEKARTLEVDAVILDLEDAVAPDRKADARLAAVSALGAVGFRAPTVLVRVNAFGTPEFAQDAAALGGTKAPVLLPKVEDAAALAGAREALGPRPFWAMIETCLGVVEASRIARAGREFGLEAFVAGANDLASELGCRLGDNRAPLQTSLQTILLAARAGGLAALDSVYNAIGDPEGLRREAEEGARLGFDGKTLIHPSQIEICRRAFSPDADEIAWAEKIVAAFADPANGAVNALAIDGRMFERLHLPGARRTLARAG